MHLVVWGVRGGDEPCAASAAGCWCVGDHASKRGCGVCLIGWLQQCSPLLVWVLPAGGLNIDMRWALGGGVDVKKGRGRVYGLAGSCACTCVSSAAFTV
jgi:hypothetical protein